MNSSILDDIKQMLGIYSDDTAFDSELIMYINNAISDLIHVGKEMADYSIQDNTNEWSEFLDSDALAGQARQYVFCKVRLLFDPPSNSFVVTEIEKAKDEAQWRFYMIKDDEEKEDGTN